MHAHLKAPSEKEYVPAWAMSVVYLGLGEEGETFEWLEQSFDERRKDLFTSIQLSSAFDPLRSDPRFADLLRRMNLQP